MQRNNSEKKKKKKKTNMYSKQNNPYVSKHI